VGAHHVRDLTVEFQMLLEAIGFALLRSVFVWVAYMAIEPYVRRRRPGLLISWTRLLSGRFADPMVGRDVLIGLLVGGVRVVIFQIDNGLPWLFDLPGMTPIPAARAALGAPGRLTSFVLQRVSESILGALAIMALLILSWVLMRRFWLALAVAGLVFALINLSGENIAVEVPMVLAVGALTILVAARYGLVALVVYQLTWDVLLAFPLTLDFSRWYAGRGMIAAAVFLGLAVYGFRVSLGGKPAFGAVELGEA